ncbi:HAD family hydrolase [Candidatus Woesearchaeota archaeon]|nr:HAD family hydrolase [Candidatus Woesearchaeota archaeon]
MTKALIFDFWGTLVENGIYSPIRQVQDILRLEMPFSEFVVKFESVFFKDVHPDLASGFEKVCEAFNVQPRQDVIEQLIGMWNKNKLLARPYPETMQVLESLRSKYKLGLMSNTDAFSVGQVMDKYALQKHFDVIFLSYQEGLLKHDAGAFDKVLSQLGVSHGEAVMIGDSIESDMEAAAKAGIMGVLVDRRGKRTYPKKIFTLNEIEEVLSHA